MTRRSRGAPTPEPPTVTMQTCSSVAVAELGAQRLAVGELGRVEPGDVAGEVEVLLGPVADRRQSRAEGARARCRRRRRRRWPGRAAAGSGRSARSSRRCSRRSGPPRARRRRASAASRRSRSAQAYAEPLQLGVLVQEVVDVPGLVADPQVVGLVATRSWKTMKFASRISSIRRIAWKACRSCSADSVSMWRDSLARCALAGMDPLAARLEHRGHRMLGQPVDLEVRVQLAQLVGDRDVAPGVAEPDRRGDVERALAAGAGASRSAASAGPARRNVA